MGTIADLVKKAEAEMTLEKVAGSPVDDIIGQSGDLNKYLADQDATMSQMVDSPSESAFNNALTATKYIAGTGVGIAGLLAVLRYLDERARDKRVIKKLMGKSEYSKTPADDKTEYPLGEKTVPVKFASDKQAVANVADVLGDAYGSAEEYVGSGWDKVKEIFGKMVEPARGKGWTHPYGFPMMLGGGALATLAGSTLFDAVLDKLRERRRKREIEDAENEFQTALAKQYTSKESSIYNMIDGLSRAHAAGELNSQLKGLEKVAGAGVLPAGLGLYLAALMFLAGSGAYHGYHSAEEGDTDRRRSEALERTLTRRGAANPPQFILKRPNDMDEEPV